MQKVIAFAFLLSLAGFTGTASAGTAEEQAACQDDAFKFCNDAVPDEDKVKACLTKNRRKLSPACRAMFSGGRSRRK